MALAAEILTVLRAEAGQFNATVREAQASTSGLGSATTALATVGRAAFLAFGAAAVAASVIGIKASLEHEQAHARLVTAIRNSGSAWEEQAAQVEHLDGRMRTLGFTDSTTESSLATLTNATHNTEQAMNLMGLAADIARGRHIGLEEATAILVKVETGRVGMLGRIGIATKDATGATISQEEAIKRLTALYGGQGTAYAETFAGKLQQLEAQLNHIAVTIGDFLIPILTDLFGGLANVIDFFERNTAVAIALGAAIGGPLVAAMTYFVGLKIISFIEAIVNGMIGLLNVIPGVTVGTVALTTAHREAATAAAEQAAAEQAAAEAAAAQVIAEAEAAAAVEAANLGIGEQIALLDDQGAALDFGTAQTQLFATSQYEAAAAEQTFAAAGETAGTSLIGILGPIGLIAAGIATVIGVTYAVASAFGWLDNQETAAARGGRELADANIKSILASNDVVSAYQKIGAELKDSTTALGAQEQATARTAAQYNLLDRTLNRGVGTTKDSQDSTERLTAAQTEYQKALDKLRPEYERAVEDQKKVSAETTVMAHSLGVVIPYATELSSTALKSLQKGVSEMSATFGQAAAQTAVDARLTGTQMTDVVNQAKNFAKSLEGAITSATDPFAKFASATNVSTDELSKFFVGSNLQAAAWATEIQGLIERGVNSGIIDQMAKAGPGSKPALDAFVALVDEKGVDWVNSVAASGDQAAKATEAAYNSMAVTAAIKSAELATVSKAAFQDLQEGGISHLQALEGGTDREMAGMAYAIATHVAEMNGSINTLPKDTPLHVYVEGTAEAQAAIDSLHYGLQQITGKPWDVVVNVTDQGGFAAAANAGASDRNIKHDITPVT